LSHIGDTLEEFNFNRIFMKSPSDVLGGDFDIIRKFRNLHIPDAFSCETDDSHVAP
jgi:hypothetical protein